MYALTDRILSMRPASVAGLGLIARAASLRYDDDLEASGESPRERNMIEALCTFCGVEPLFEPLFEDEERAAS